MVTTELPHSRPGAEPDVDLLGVGIGPFNLALAALADGVPGLRTRFLDAAEDFSWHPGLMVDGATLQVPFLADLVTLVDPRSRFSFLNYLAEKGRLFPFYVAERFHPSREEYQDYCRWAVRELPSCRFGSRVVALRWRSDRFEARIDGVGAGVVTARHVVLGVGTEQLVPPAFAGLGPGDELCLSDRYLDHRERLLAAPDVTVVGSGQSGAEIVLDLLRARGARGLRWLTRSSAFAPMEYSKLGLEHFTPDYTRYFHGLDPAVRERLLPTQDQLYKAASAETLAAIHELLYAETVRGGRPDVELCPGVEVTGARRAAGGRITLDCHHAQRAEDFAVRTDAVVLATGHARSRPALLDPMLHQLRLDEHGRYRVDLDHRVACAPEVTGGLFVQNAELHTHGVGTPDLGLGAHRAAVILNAVVGRTVHRLPDRAAFTTFGVPASARAGREPAAAPTSGGRR